MVREKFKNLVETAISDGFSRGVQLYLENLDAQIAADVLYEARGIDSILQEQFEEPEEEEEDAPMTDEEEGEVEEFEDIDEELINKLMKKVIEKE